MNEGHEHSLPGRFAVFSAKNGKPDVVTIAKSYLPGMSENSKEKEG